MFVSPVTQLFPRWTFGRFPFLAVLTFTLLIASTARAQIGTGFAFGGTPGVYLDVGGNVRCREVDEKDHLAAVRARAKAAVDAAKNEKLAFISLPKLFEQVQSLRAAGKDIPEELRYLGGITQLRYVLVFPDEKDVVIAGPAEPWVVLQGPGRCRRLCHRQAHGPADHAVG